MIKLVLFFFVTIPFCNAQTNYLDYHQKINEAELNLIDSNYTAALSKYREAFRIMPNAFAKDYYNALITTVLLEEYKQSFDFLEQLKCKQLPVSELEKPILASLQQRKEWKKFRQDYESTQLKCRHKHYTMYRDTLQALIDIDQYYASRRAKLADAKAHPDSVRMYADSLNWIINRNTDILISLVNQYGFPDEGIVGVSKLTFREFFDVLLRHAVQAGRMDILPVLEKSLKQGYYNPYGYAELKDLNQNKITYSSCVLRGSPDNLQEVQFTDEETVAFNQNRQEIGLCSLEDLRRKALFSIKDKRFLLNIHGAINLFFESREAMLEYFKNHPDTY